MLLHTVYAVSYNIINVILQHGILFVVSRSIKELFSTKLFIAFISLKWLVSPRCPIWHTFDSICYIYTSKVFKYISPLIFLKGSGYRVSFIAIMTHIKVVPNYFKFAIFDLKVLLVLIENDVKGQSLQNTILYQLLAMLTELKHM